MCFVLDANSFHRLFETKSKQHLDFIPLLKWLYNNPKTSLVIGGSTYRKEVNQQLKYGSYLVELKRARKISDIADDLVDIEERRLKSLVTHPNFNDAHIIAIICVSGCRIFASHDKSADPYIKMNQLYPKGQKPPHIYRTSRHTKMLKDENIVSSFRLGFCGNPQGVKNIKSLHFLLDKKTMRVLAYLEKNFEVQICHILFIQNETGKSRIVL